MLRFLIILLLIAFSFNANAKEDYLKQLKIPNELKIYSKAYKDAQNSMQPQPIENIYKLGEEAKAAFFANNSDELISNIVWDEGDAREKFEKKMAQLVPGYQIQQGAELFYYETDSKAFLELAKKSGREKDIEFFKFYNQNFPNGEIWPSYVEQQTDITACTKYGSPEYLEFYKSWSGFIEKYPEGYYSDLAKKYLSGFDVSSRCSCDSKEASIIGLETLATIIRDVEIERSLKTEIQKRKNMPYSPPNQPGGWYGYNAESCGG